MTIGECVFLFLVVALVLAHATWMIERQRDAHQREIGVHHTRETYLQEQLVAALGRPLPPPPAPPAPEPVKNGAPQPTVAMPMNDDSESFLAAMRARGLTDDQIRQLYNQQAAALAEMPG